MLDQCERHGVSHNAAMPGMTWCTHCGFVTSDNARAVELEVTCTKFHDTPDGNRVPNRPVRRDHVFSGTSADQSIGLKFSTLTQSDVENMLSTVDIKTTDASFRDATKGIPT